MTTRVSLFLSRGIWVLLFVATSVVLLSVGWLYYRHRVEINEDQSYLKLQAISELKSREILRWRNERLDDVTGLSRNSARRQAVSLIVEGEDAPETREVLLQGLTVWEELADAGLSLVSPEGTVIVSTRSDDNITSPATQWAIRTALTNETGVLSDFFLNTAGTVQIDAVAAMRDSDGQPLACLILRSDAAKYLFPLIQSWPMPSASAETLIVQRAGDEVLFLNELRQRARTALRYREPLSNTNLPAVQAVSGKEGRFAGLDYRGVPVLADIRPIPGSPWFMVAKVDQEEIFAEARRESLLVGALVALSILLAGVATAYGYRREQARLYRGLCDSKQRELEAQEAFRTTLYSIGDAVITTDAGGHVREMNRVAEQLTGWKEQEGRGRQLEEVFRIINETTREKLVSPTDLVLREKRIVGLANHTLLIARDGTERPIADSAAPICGADGVITGVVLVFSDQTAQHTARKALGESEERLRLALNAANQGLYDLNVQTGECVVNAEYALMLGYDPNTFQETNAAWRERLHPDDRDTVYRAYEDYVAGRTAEYRVEFRQRTASGEWKWILSQGRLMSSSPDGRPLRMLGTHTDINKRKQMEEELAASRRILQEVADNSPALIFITDINGRFLLVSRHAESAVGSPRERVIGKTREEVLPKDVATVHLANDRQVILTGQPMTFEEENFEKDGRHVYLSTKFPLFDVDGTVYGVGCISTDITERKQTEEALQISLREKQALLKEVHHRVKNNLQVITSLLRLESARIEHPTTRSVLRGMQDRIRSMALLHETLYRSENFAQVDMKMYLGQIVAQLFRAQSAAPSSNQPGLGLPESAADIRMELDIAAVQLGVDQAIPCGLIVNELVSNCLKHGFPNGRAGVVRVEFGALDGGAQLRLCVSDDGVGLPTNLAYRQDRSLGLQLVSDLAGQLGGRLELDSSQGTSFAVRFVPVTGGDTQLFRKE